MTRLVRVQVGAEVEWGRRREEATVRAVVRAVVRAGERRR